MIRRGMTVNIVAGPREPTPCAMAGGRLWLLDRPKNPGFVAHVQGHTEWWEHSNVSAEDAVRMLCIRLAHDGIKHNDPIFKTQPIYL